MVPLFPIYDHKHSQQMNVHLLPTEVAVGTPREERKQDNVTRSTCPLDRLRQMKR